MESYTNDLIHESSPYLLQHAHNPVNWVAWSPEVFERAKRENKLVLISVGYSACHWCHVMEHESFEDEEVAALMNKFFINVKVDREERPDVDQLYMTAVQLMTNKGGWPMNCFTLPDGRPIYGGTYFPKEQWMHILRSLEHTFKNDLKKVEEYADHLMEGVAASETIVEPNEVGEFKREKLEELILRWKKSFDLNEGGPTRAPKFPLPNNLDFLMDYALNSKDQTVLDYAELTLDKMAMGGMYDQAGGGFARYSVDMLWKIPHFEKMLYDNGQLIYTYARAYAIFKKPLYRRIVDQTINWMEREMLDASGAFISALDADSEGVEGKYYIWSKKEMDAFDQESKGFFSAYYDTGNRAYWEDGQFVLLRTKSDQEVCKNLNISPDEFERKIAALNEQILSARKERVYPGKDDKCLTSWNAMVLKGLSEAYRVFGEDHYRSLAYKNYKWLTETMMNEKGQLKRNYKNGKLTIDAFLEDYASLIDALIHYYYMEGDIKVLEQAELLTTVCLSEFKDEQSGMFYFTPSNTDLLARKMEINDNVIPSGNSIMARNLFQLSILLHREEYMEMSKQMLANVYDGMETYGSGYSNWALLLDHFVFNCYEYVCTGEPAKENAMELAKASLPFGIMVYANGEKYPPVFDQHDQSHSLIYVCAQGYCLKPSSTVEEAIDTVMKNKL